MINSKDFNRTSIITGVLLNLIMTMVFIVFIILGYRSTIENATIQDATAITHFQSRLILKSINGLSHSRADILIALKDNNFEKISDAEDHALGAKSNYKLLLSEQTLNKAKISSFFEADFDEITRLFNKVFEQNSIQKSSPTLLILVDKMASLVERMHNEESGFWVDEAFKLHEFSQIKERNLHIFYALTACFILIQLIFIYFTIIKYTLNKKINIQHERLVLQTRLSTLGMMSAELAHEINSPLMVIDGRLRILQNELNNSSANANEKIHKNIEIIKRNSQRIQGIIKSFKTMSRSGDSDAFEHLNLEVIFDDVKDLVSQKLNDEHIEFILAAIDGELIISSRRIQIVQVLTNLINNSMDAIRNQLDPWIKVESSILNNKIIICVTDSGLGIPREDIDQIFDPFYSTKGLIEGTGLGLSISKKIMKDHGGDLVYNPDSPNTQFILTFKHENEKAHSQRVGP